MIPPVRAGMTLGFGLLVTHGFGLSLVPALLPHIAASLDAGYTELGLAVASGLLSYLIGALGSGWLLERIPNRLLLLATFVVPSVALIGVSQATSGVAIAVAVALLGVNAGVSWPVSLHTLASTVHADARTAVMSGAGAGVGLGLIVNGILVQLTGSAVTWQQAVQVASVIALVPILLAFVVFRDQIQPPSGTEPARGAYRRAASSTTGKVIILAGLAGGFFGFPIVAFLSVVGDRRARRGCRPLSGAVVANGNSRDRRESALRATGPTHVAAVRDDRRSSDIPVRAGGTGGGVELPRTGVPGGRSSGVLLPHVGFGRFDGQSRFRDKHGGEIGRPRIDRSRRRRSDRQLAGRSLVRCLGERSAVPSS